MTTRLWRADGCVEYCIMLFILILSKAERQAPGTRSWSGRLATNGTQVSAIITAPDNSVC